MLRLDYFWLGQWDMNVLHIFGEAICDLRPPKLHLIYVYVSNTRKIDILYIICNYKSNKHSWIEGSHTKSQRCKTTKMDCSCYLHTLFLQTLANEQACVFAYYYVEQKFYHNNYTWIVDRHHTHIWDDCIIHFYFYSGYRIFLDK